MRICVPAHDHEERTVTAHTMSPHDFYDLGIAPIPLLPRSKRPAVAWGRYQAQMPTKADVDAWFNPSSPLNAGVVCGWQGLTVLDFDTVSSFDNFTLWMRENSRMKTPHPEHADATSTRITPAFCQPDISDVLATTYRVDTHRGTHLYLLVDDHPGTTPLLSPDGELWGEVRGHGAYAVCPPSIHPSGTRYTDRYPDAPIRRLATLDGLLPIATIATSEAPGAVQPAHTKRPHQADRAAFDLATFPPLERTPARLIRATYSLLDLLPDARPASTSGRWYIARCPLHHDTNPSFWIDTDRAVCGCHAPACRAHSRPLDYIALYALLNQLSVPAAIRHLMRPINGT
jgi:hypothetical protein